MNGKTLSPPKEAGAMEAALSQLRKLILEGDLSPGEQIRQQEMAEQFGVSRVPLREALNVLADQGLLAHRPYQGYFVAKRGPSEMRQIRRMLELLETELMDSVVWPDARQLTALRGLNDQLRKLVSSVGGAFTRTNREFHFRIFEMSPDKLILEEVRRLWNLADPLIAAKLASPDARRRTIDEHEAILDALKAQDRAKCQQASHLHRRSSDVHAGFVPETAPARRRSAR